MEGALDDILNALRTAENAERLANLLSLQFVLSRNEKIDWEEDTDLQRFFGSVEKA